MRSHLFWRGACALILAVGLVACGEEPQGTGGQLQALYIHPPGYMVAAGLWTRVEIPDRRYFPIGANRSSATRTASWDFNDTTLEIDAPTGFDFEVSSVTNSDSEEAQDFRERHDAGGFILRTMCNAEAGFPHDIHLRVKKGAEVRYEDIFTLTCHNPTRLRLLGLTPGRYMVGGRVLTEVRLTVTTALGPTPLGGEGLALTDRKGLLQIESSSQVARTHIALLEVVAPGSEPEISFENVRSRLPMETVAVEQDAWRLELGAAQPDTEGPNVNWWTLPVQAFDAKGELFGLHTCSWEITTVGGTTLKMSGCLATVRGPSAPARACVKTMGKDVCRDYL
ncbi:hypothetical protein [Hyalangium rubrum]|uniref:Lipoprotein n=1 Tax=Hyalangium rubrum TaxID=3103134 RepID=A0ABU5H005_9BACT|nr:hypothetical protein [Hyalangium sp. s54d21]MDY7226274.1 hypothetical protein [Hyalangium sp. s54d21]